MRYLPFFLFFCSLQAIAQQNTSDSIRNQDVIFQKVEIEASYPGGSAAWRNFLARNLNVNIPVQHHAPAGIYKVIVELLISNDGSISTITPLTDFGYGMENEVVRVISLSGKWIPCVQNGRNVKSVKKQPVTFFITAEGYNIETDQGAILYRNMENRIRIKVDNLKTADIEVSILNGTIQHVQDTDYLVTPGNQGRVIIRLTNKITGTEIGASVFDITDKPGIRN